MGDQVEPRREFIPMHTLDVRILDVRSIYFPAHCMNYWFDAFTGITWDEFRTAGAKVTGFRDHNWKRAEKIRPGDVFLCYIVGVTSLTISPNITIQQMSLMPESRL